MENYPFTPSYLEHWLSPKLLCYCRSDLGFRSMSEQVSHHPPISAFNAESKSYRITGSIHPKLKFWGKSVEVNPKGMITLEFKR